MPMVTRSGDDSNKKIDELKKKLDELYTFMIIDEGLIASSKMPEIQRLLEELKQDNILYEILNGITELKTKFNRQEKLLSKIASLISKMYQDGEINKNTFNKLDEFLKPYYDNSYQQDNY